MARNLREGSLVRLKGSGDRRFVLRVQVARKSSSIPGTQDLWVVDALPASDPDYVRGQEYLNSSEVVRAHPRKGTRGVRRHTRSARKFDSWGDL